MKWISVLSRKSRWEEALRQCVAKIQEEAEGAPDVALIFLTHHFSGQYDEVSGDVCRQLNPKHFMGCSAGGIVAGGVEVEDQPGLGLMVGFLPGVEVTSFHLESDQLPDMDAPPMAWAKALSLKDRNLLPQFIILSDPFSFNPEDISRGLDYAFAGAVTVGGLASGAMQPLQNALFLNRRVYRSGLVGMAFTGNISMEAIVAQGCRPIGKPLKITRCEQNLLIELDGRPALTALEETIDGLSDEDQELARHSLFVGMLNNPMSSADSKRDYLVRNLIGMNVEHKVLAVGAMLRPGQTIQFHLRDKKTSAEDLEEALRHYAESKPAPVGALLFSCVGRGQNLYGVPNHDTDAFRKALGQAPIGGFFCNGEIGPVGGVTYLHGYTSCFAVFRPGTLSSKTE